MNDFMQPPLRFTASHELRKVGFELEYGAIPLQKSAELLLSVVESGTIEKINSYYYKIKNTPYGHFNLVLDFQFLVSQGLQKWLQDTGLDQIIETEIALDLEEFIATISQTVVPYEITTPPLLLDDIELIESIKETFRIHGALGTDANPFYAFGFHINPEVTSFEVTEIIDILRAFFILYENLLI